MSDMQQTTLTSYGHRHFLRHRSALLAEQQVRFAAVDEELFELTESAFVGKLARRGPTRRQSDVPHASPESGVQGRVSRAPIVRPEKRRILQALLGLVLVVAAVGWYVTRPAVRPASQKGLMDMHLPYGVPQGLSTEVSARKGYAYAFDSVRRLSTLVTYRVFPGDNPGTNNKPDPMVSNQLTKADYSGSKWQMLKLVPVLHVSRGLNKVEINEATQIREEIRYGITRFRTRGNYFQFYRGMPHQQAHQFDPGVPGATNYSYLYHFNVQIIPLNWTRHYTSTPFRDH